MSANRIRHLGAVGLVVTVGLAASSASASAPATGSRQATDSAQASSKIAFIIRGSDLPTSKRGPQTPGIYVMNADGSGKRLLTRSTSHLYAWSPDGRKIAFTGGDGDVYAINADGSGRRNLTRRAVDYGGDEGACPAWSPNGQKIAFDRGRGRGIFVMNADGSGQRRLTQFGRQARWSPDGRMIAFLSFSAGNVEIFVMNADGSGLRNLTRTPKADEVRFAWEFGQVR